MARTKKIILFYFITPKEIIPPPQGDVDRKNEWIKTIQGETESEQQPKMIKTTYELFNPEIEQMMKFFNGPVIKYYAIQNDDLLEGEIEPERIIGYRKMILNEVLGYDIDLPDGTKLRERESTGDWKDTQEWYNFLETLKEGMFAEHGYEFPDSKFFNELKEKHGYAQAEKVVLQKLRDKMKTKLVH